MQITFWGAAQTVTGSQHLLTVGTTQVLLDCGLFQGKRSEADAINRKLPFQAARVSGLILSHAHIDHCGNIPNLVKNGFGGDVHCTHATRDLAATMMRDSGSIQESDARFLNDRNRDKPPVEPIYTIADAEHAAKSFVSYNYERWFDAAPGVRAQFLDAGHMLGSASVALALCEGVQNTRLCFSGDLGRAHMPILRDPQPMPEADYLILESTYGGRKHQSIASIDEDLRDAIATTARRGGKVVIPAFAVGRTQEIVYRLNALINAGELPDVPVFVDSPLAVNVTEAFRTHSECYDDEIRTMLRNDPDGSVFGFTRLKYVRTVEESKALNQLEGPAVIISASGMCENGRILHHLRHTIGDANNMILFVSYQAGNTLGRRILDGQRYVKILGDEFTVRAETRRIEAFSGHADQDDLLAWVEPRARGLKGVFLVHGEPESMAALAEGLRGIGVQNVVTPARGESAELQ
jgi:metallo-beta-lactamase family protein